MSLPGLFRCGFSAVLHSGLWNAKESFHRSRELLKCWFTFGGSGLCHLLHSNACLLGEGMPIFWWGGTDCTRTRLRVAEEYFAAIFNKFWIWFPTSAERSVRQKILVTNCNAIAHQRVRNRLASCPCGLMRRSGIVFQWLSGSGPLF